MMNVADNFQAFRNAYVIDQAKMESISYRYKRITKQLNSDFWTTQSDTAHSLYIGSYGRDTAAKGVSDVDIYFRLPTTLYLKYSNYQTNGQSALLQTVRSSMQSTYPSTVLKGDGQVVTVNFTDGITFEVLPGFLNAGNRVTFPDSNNEGSWKTCDPQAEMSAFALRNSESNHNLKAICRMARIWKEHNNVPISGMLIDTLAYQFIGNWEYKLKSYLYHDFLVRDFFYYLWQTDVSQEWWKAPGSGSWVHKTGSFRIKAKDAHEAALKAIKNTTDNQDWAAKEAWQMIFGTTYNV
jgi:Second Messenger Oligonucleotide or Dinucleotide Synthetase domain